MNKNNYKNKWDRNLVVCLGTDIPPMSNAEFMIYGRIIELIDQKETHFLSMDDIFEGYTHTKRGRFSLISRLIKKKLIKRSKVPNNKHLYEIIPKMSYRESKEMRIYQPKTRRELLETEKYFMRN
jgi:hypothetical protein